MRNKRERINFRITLTIAMVLISIISLFILINLNFISAATYQNGSDIYQDSSNWNGTYSNDNFTISAWIYLKNPGTSPVIYRPFLYQLLVNPNNKTELRLNNGTGFSSSGIIDLNSWTFVAASYNGTSINLYINNNNKTFTAYSGGYLKPSNTFEAIMGRNSFNYFNGTIDEVRVFNKALNENEINLLYYSNLRKYDTGKWLLNIVQTGLQIGSQYIYSFFIRDFAGLSNSTEIRTIKGNTAPAFILISYSPNSTDNMDPNINVNITANISDTDNNFDSGVLQWKNSTQNNWNNVTMLNLTVKSSYTILNGNFTLPSYEDNITLRILINDTTGDATLSNNYTLPNYWDCTWTATSNLGSTAG